MNFLDLLYANECFSCMCAWYTMCVPDAQESQKRSQTSMDLELGIIVGYHVGSRNQIQIFCKNNQCS